MNKMKNIKNRYKISLLYVTTTIDILYINQHRIIIGDHPSLQYQSNRVKRKNTLKFHIFKALKSRDHH